MMELLAVGTFWFWAIIVAELVLLFVFTEYENGWAASVSFALFVAALQFWSKVDLFGFVTSHPFHLIAAAAIFGVCGVSWGIFRWRKYVLDRLAKHDELYEEFLVTNRLDPKTVVLPPDHRAAWKRVVDSTKNYDRFGYDSTYWTGVTGETVADVPQARRHKARIVRWMTLWMFSFALYVFKDMVAEMFSAVYKKLAGFLQRIADNLYGARDLSTNLEVPGDTPDARSRRNT